MDRSIVKEEQFRVRVHDLVLGLCKTMEVDEQQSWHIGLINAYRFGTDGGVWWKIEDDGHISANLSRHLIASGHWTELEALLYDVRCTLRRYEMGG